MDGFGEVAVITWISEIGSPSNMWTRSRLDRTPVLLSIFITMQQVVWYVFNLDYNGEFFFSKRQKYYNCYSQLTANDDLCYRQ